MNPLYYARKHLYSAATDGPRGAAKAAAVEALSKAAAGLSGDRGIASRNGVAVRNIAVGADDVFPEHKRHLVDATLEISEPGDRVVFVGGGPGVAPTRAARECREVIVYEAAVEMVELCGETAELNKVDMEIVHAVVEAGREVFGTLGGAETLRTGDLEGDVLVLDCEGAEADILPAPQFDAVIVETHPQHGADTAELTGAEKYDTTPHEGDCLVRQ